jgi:hypothetical protein
MTSNILSNKIYMNTPNEVIEVFKKQNPSNRIKPFNNNGEFTQKFIKFNRDLLQKGRTNVVAFNYKSKKEGKQYKISKDKKPKNEIKVFNKNTNRLIDLVPKKGKSSFFTTDGKLRKTTRVEQEDLVLTKYDVLEVSKDKRKNRLDSKYLNNLYKEYNLNNISKRTTKEDFINFEIDRNKFQDKEYGDIGRNRVLDFLNKIDRSNNNVIISDGTTYTTLRPKNISKIRTLLTVDIDSETAVNEYESDAKTVYSIFSSAPKIFVSIRGKGKNKAGGGFFPYTHKLDKIDLTRYSIFQDVKAQHYENNCLLYALELAGFNVAPIKTFVFNQTIPMCKLNQVAKELDIYISVSKMDTNNNNRVRKSYYGDKTKKLVELCIVEQHYFLLEKTEYTKYSIENYFDICDEKDFNLIYDSKFRKRKDRFINSFDLVKLLIENKKRYLEQITKTNELYKTIYDNKITEFKNLEYDETENTKLNEFKEPKDPPNETYYFDFETITNSKNKEEKRFHKPYCVFTDKHPNGFFGDNCGELLLKDLVEKHGVEKGETKPLIRLIAHNSTYDFRFLVKYLTVINTIEKGNSLVNASCFYTYNNRSINIQIRDSLKMINMPLQKFGKVFKLDQEKEIMPYDLYTEEYVEQQLINKKICLEYVKKQEQEEYLNNCRKLNCIYKVKNSDEELIDIIKYAAWYCYCDCVVLKKGYERFSSMCMEAIKFDSKDYLTLASMADNYLKYTGCYKDVYQLSGVPRDFIQKCVVGGRTMCKQNKKQIRNIDYADYDACSLYPSAMCRMKGFLRGIPKVIYNFEPEKYDGYFIKIKILKVGKKYDFPLQSIMTDKGIRNFTNDLEGKEIYIDKIALEDLINFQKVEYQFIQGYYYNEGHNDTINKVMTELYQNRKRYKKEKNDIQMVFKELMNSSYGKSCLKPIDTDFIYKREKDLDIYVDRYFNYIKEYTRIADSNIFKIKTDKAILKHFNNVHIGVEILSMSKRIMNEVMCLAEDLNIDMTYQDTDSIHMPLKDVPLLEEKFKEKYNRNLAGQDTGNFHVDFDMDGIKKDAEIKSIKSIFLGKKCYIDKLQSINDKDEIIYDYHIRMKGVSEDCIKYKANQEYNGDVFRIYEDLFNKKYTGTGNQKDNNFEDKKGLQFDLTAVKPKFEHCKDMRIFTKDKFLRNLYFD